MENISWSAALIATAVMAVAYLFIGACVASSGRWAQKSKILGWLVVDPRKIIAGSNRIASLSNLQMLFFTLVVLWLSIYWLLQSGVLVELQGDLAILLGIAGSGTILGKATDTNRSLLTQVNFSWVKRKGWVEKDLIEGKYDDRTPRLFDLITTGGKFDVSRFQALGFTLVIGASLLWEGILADVAGSSGVNAFEFSVGPTYLSLIGVSQGLYVGGKFSQKDSTKQLDVKLNEVREKERAFGIAVSKCAKWQEKSASFEAQSKELLDLARVCAPEAYSEFLYVAEEASSLVSGLSGKPIYETAIRPSLPPVCS